MWYKFGESAMLRRAIREYLRELRRLFPRKRKRSLGIFNGSVKRRGYALLSYRADSPTWRKDDRRFLLHSNGWECAEIAKAFNDLGFAVDAIWHDDTSFRSHRRYDSVFDIHRNLVRYSSDDSLKIMHITGSHPRFSSQAEHRRLKDLLGRRGLKLSARRAMSESDISMFDSNLAAADRISLIGNGITRSTFQEDVRYRMRLINPTGSFLSTYRPTDVMPRNREFLWFNGYGAIHKGLDLVLEVFSKNPKFTLHVVGEYERELDFVRAYRKELYDSPNIVSHGYVYPSDRQFQDIARNVVAFISPSCSEGMSTSAITCMQYGLVPILSEECGIDIEEGMGLLLGACTLDQIQTAVDSVLTMNDGQLQSLMRRSQAHSTEFYSREKFSREIRVFLSEALNAR